MSTVTTPRSFVRGAIAVWAFAALILQLPLIAGAGWFMALLLIPATAGLGLILTAQIKTGAPRIPLVVPLALGSLALFLVGLAAGIALASSLSDPRVMPIGAVAFAHAAVAVGAYVEYRRQVSKNLTWSTTP